MPISLWSQRSMTVMTQQPLKPTFSQQTKFARDSIRPIRPESRPGKPLKTISVCGFLSTKMSAASLRVSVLALSTNTPPVATYQIEELAATQPRSSSSSEVENLPHQLEAPATIGEVMARAREQVAAIAGVDVEAVKFDLKVEY